MEDKILKEDCVECKDLPEGEVTEGHDHTVVEETASQETPAKETIEETVTAEETPAEEAIVEPSAEEEKPFDGEVVEITGDEARAFRSKFDQMHRTHRGEIIIGNTKVVCKG